MKVPMQYSKTGLALTERFEGCRLEAYRDVAGVLTIGYGHTGPDVYEGQTCTQQQAMAWLILNTQEAVDAVNRLVTPQLSQHEFDALVDFVFNLGEPAFAHSTMLRLLNSGDIALAAGQFALWDHIGGREVAGLLRRRLAEKAEFLDA